MRPQSVVAHECGRLWVAVVAHECGRLGEAGAVHKPADFCRAGAWAGARVRFLQFYVQHPASPQSFTHPQPPDSPPARRSPPLPIIYLQLRLSPHPHYCCQQEFGKLLAK